MASLVAQMVKNLTAMQGTQDLSLGREDALEKGMAAHSVAWRTPWTEEPGGPVHWVTKELDTTEHACGESYHTPPLWCPSPAVGPEGRQVAWKRRPG